MGEGLAFFITLILGGTAVSGVKIIQQGDEALVETLGKYSGKKLKPGLNYVIPMYERIAIKQTVKERVLDIPPQKCITRDNVQITVDAVVYWRVLDLEKAYYKVENLQSAMTNLVLTQIRSEMGKLELDEAFTARQQINEILLRELDEATDPWGVKVTRVELRDIIPSKTVQESMELQMSAERQKRAAILTSEGQRESAINSAKGQAEAQILAAEAQQRSTILAAEAEQKATILQAEAQKQQQILKAQAIAESAKLIGDKIKKDPNAYKALEVLFALGYLDMGTIIGKSDSSKIMFIDPHTIPAALAGIKAMMGEEVQQQDTWDGFDKIINDDD
jgi:regulator of protease activity HflC (stomatin/prohibitin superfamily)